MKKFGFANNKNRIQRGGFNHDQQRQQIPANNQSRLSPLPSTYDRKYSRPVKKEEFKAHVTLMSAENDFQFTVEYEELRHTGRSNTSLAGEECGNKEKNRFNNVLPFDHSRVQLTSKPDSDYINANFIPGSSSDRDYIGTQGPLSWTADDFWAMVWEQNVEMIVNLTRCFEKGKEKCHRYWPKTLNESLKHRDIDIQLESQEDEREWIHRSLQITKDSESRHVSQLHFVGWPDFGVPSETESIVSFIRAFRRHYSLQKHKNPVIVHCSAGIGRTGTLIAIDTIMNNLDSHNMIDVFGTVHKLRQSRVSMVQTEQQYSFIHHCILYVLDETGDDQRPQHLHSTTSNNRQQQHSAFALLNNSNGGDMDISKQQTIVVDDDGGIANNMKSITLSSSVPTNCNSPSMWSSPSS